MADRGLLSLSDARLLRRSGSDAEAFAVFYRRYERLVLGWGVRRLGDVEAAADLLAETFAAAWLSRESFQAETGLSGSAAPWLLGIARNKLRVDARRQRIETAARERLGIVTPPIEPGQARELEALFSDAERWLEGLPESQRDAVRAYVLEDEDYAGVATRLNIEQPAARQRVSRGLAALRERFEHQGGRQ